MDQNFVKTSKLIETRASVDWKEVYDQLLPRVFHFFCYKIGDRLLAEELTSVTFEKAWIGREHYKKDVSEFTFWLFGIAQKVAADHFRKLGHQVPLDSVQIASSQNVEKELEKKLDFEKLAPNGKDL
jgi:DNA-directed RNA polymerase specialized sigma24 family protein